MLSAPIVLGVATGKSEAAVRKPVKQESSRTPGGADYECYPAKPANGAKPGGCGGPGGGVASGPWPARKKKDMLPYLASGTSSRSHEPEKDAGERDESRESGDGLIVAIGDMAADLSRAKAFSTRWLGR